ncbi:hypothetical protein ERO13_A08G214433v2 [Gossypium hirsutum]|nr:hypothetical protein ERO13_A08G214433v2 [Gossypium hirsutum]
MVDEQQRVQIPRVKLGTQGLEVSKLGFGCTDDVGIIIIKHAFEKGITFFNTTDFIGPGGLVVSGTPEYVCASLESSLKRLDVDYIDLYYIIRVDTKTPIEETNCKKFVEEGKIKYIGISEASPETIRRAHAVHPITAGLGIGIVPYSPLGQGFSGNSYLIDSLTDYKYLLFKAMFPRFQGENLDKNRILYLKVKKLAEKHVWDDVAPIPGNNIESLKVKLTEEDLKEISEIIPINEVAGATLPENLMQFTWKYINTPPKNNTKV